MNEQQQPRSLTEDGFRTLTLLINFIHFSTYPLRLYSRKPGTVGASAWFPGIIVGFFLMMIVTELSGGHTCILAWHFSCVSWYLLLTHLIIYLRRHKQGTGVHTHYVGEPWFGSEQKCDATFAIVFAVVSFALNEQGFAIWWLANVPCSLLSVELLRQRDNARQRQITSTMIEQRYWQAMVHNARREHDFE
ncbi:MAG: hypothetical protein R3E01_22030 [Pirellulaceae bacterium]|nr:hypothetical protein [Planctomycetales bacterium]